MSSDGLCNTDREQLLQWFFAARRQIAAGRRDRAHELLGACLALEPDNLLVGKLFVENLVARSEQETASPRRRFLAWPRKPRTWRQITDWLLHWPRDQRALEALVQQWSSEAPAGVLCEVLPVIASYCQDSHRCWLSAARALTSVGRCDAALHCWEQASRTGELKGEDAAIAEVLRTLPPLEAKRDAFDEDEELAALAERVAVIDKAAAASDCDLIHRLAACLREHLRDATIDIFRRRVDRKPHDESSRCELVRALRQTGDWHAVFEVLHAAPDPIHHPELLAARAEFHQRAHEFGEALQWYEQAIRQLEQDDQRPFSRAWVQRAIELAASCGRSDLADRWAALVATEHLGPKS